MKVDLKNYLDARDKIRDYENSPGPVVTISRAFGCDATPIAIKLIKRIEDESDNRTNQKWNIISKEILDEASRELKVNPKKIENLMDTKTQGAMKDIFSSFGNYYGISDKKIIETLKDVINLYAYQGKSIIVGRAGAYIAKKIPDSVHIKLHAHLDWRVNQIQSKRNLNKADAKTLVEGMDQKRTSWIENLIKGKPDVSVYDIIFNRETMTDDMIVDMVMVLLINRKIISTSHAELVY